jgi:glycosyltransferase involved in cell wall biosynthesis
MIDIRWFAPNAYAALLVPELRNRGVSIALDGTAPARLALSMSATRALTAWRFARRHRCPLVLYIWDLPPKSTGSGSYDPVIPFGRYLLRVPRLSGGYARRRGYYSRLRFIASRAQEVWVPSSLTGELVRARFGISPQLVPYCYDSHRFCRARVLKESPPTLLTVGRLQAHKNHEVTIRAASLIDRRVQVRLIGRGPERDRLARLARSLQVACRIETSIDDDGVVEAYRQASVAVCPSRFEGLGLTPIEAIASGTPVVASAIPPHREFLGSAARLVPVDDVQAWTEQIAEALDDGPPDAAALSQLTIPAAAERFLGRLRPLLKPL